MTLNLSGIKSEIKEYSAENPKEQAKYVCHKCGNDSVPEEHQMIVHGKPLCFRCGYGHPAVDFILALDSDLQGIIIQKEGVGNVEIGDFLSLQIVRELKKLNRWAFKPTIIQQPNLTK